MKGGLGSGLARREDNIVRLKSIEVKKSWQCVEEGNVYRAEVV